MGERSDDSTVGVESSSELLAEARSTFAPDAEFVHRVDASIDAARATGDRGELGHLLMVKIIALQGHGDVTHQADLAAEAIGHHLAADDPANAASASAMAAVYRDVLGDISGAMEHAVEALVLLQTADEDLGAEHDEAGDLCRARTLLALMGLFMRLSAFDVAVDLGRRAFDTARFGDPSDVTNVAYSFGYAAAETAHWAVDELDRSAKLAHAREAATWLEEHGTRPISTSVLAPAILAECELAAGRSPDLDTLVAARDEYDSTPPDLVAWHRLVVGATLLRAGDHTGAAEEFDAAIPGLEASGDDHCLLRAIRGRAEAFARLGDHASAFSAMQRLAELTRRRQIDQVGQLAGQVVRRAELEQTQEILRLTAEQLAVDVDVDVTTHARSRHWLERELDRHERAGGSGTVLMFDLDHFKTVNDTHGHHVGDVVLRHFANLVDDELGARRELARFGGEEFVALFPSPEEGADAAAEDIRAAVESHRWDDIAPGLRLTVSCGTATGDLARIRRLLVDADRALLAAKRAGRNRIVSAHDLAFAHAHSSDDG